MRYFLAALLVCAFSVPASALPVANAPALTNANAVIQVAKKAKAPAPSAKSKSKKSDNGIHPLVGSGDY